MFLDAPYVYINQKPIFHKVAETYNSYNLDWNYIAISKATAAKMSSSVGYTGALVAETSHSGGIQSLFTVAGAKAVFAAMV